MRKKEEEEKEKNPSFPILFKEERKGKIHKEKKEVKRGQNLIQKWEAVMGPGMLCDERRDPSYSFDMGFPTLLLLSPIFKLFFEAIVS